MKHIEFVPLWKESEPCCIQSNETIDWFAKHGWTYNIHIMDDWKSVRRIGVFYCLEVIESCVMIHFALLPDANLSPAQIREAFRKGIDFMSQNCDEVMTTIDRVGNAKLLRIMLRMGFREVTSLHCEGIDYALLKYFRD